MWLTNQHDTQNLSPGNLNQGISRCVDCVRGDCLGRGYKNKPVQCESGLPTSVSRENGQSWSLQTRISLLEITESFWHGGESFCNYLLSMSVIGKRQNIRLRQDGHLWAGREFSSAGVKHCLFLGAIEGNCFRTPGESEKERGLLMKTPQRTVLR